MNTYRILIRGFEYRLEALDAETALLYAEAFWPGERITVWALGDEMLTNASTELKVALVSR